MKARFFLWAIAAFLYYSAETTQGFADTLPLQFNDLTASVGVCANGFVSGCNAGAHDGGQDNRVATPDNSFAVIFKAIQDPRFGGHAEAGAIAHYGVLGAYTSSDAPTSTTQTLYSQGQGIASYVDLLQATTAIHGVNVATFDITEVFHGTLVPSALYAEATGSIQIGTSLYGTDIYNKTFSLTQSGSETFHTQVTVQPGHPFFIYSYLIATATTLSRDSVTHASSDFENTALTYIDSITPGVELISASGHDYSTPASVPTVPEPSSLFTSLGVVFGMFATSYFGKKLRKAN